MEKKLTTPPVLEKSEAEKSELQKIARARSTPLQISKRANILLLTSEGIPYSIISEEVKLNLNTVKTWRKHWDELKKEIEEAACQMGLHSAL